LSSVRILAFAGSLRAGSYNKKLVKLGQPAAIDAGCALDIVDLRDFPMPIYDGDLETREGLPSSARDLKRLMLKSDGLLLSCPEHNGSISAVLKNTIDWVSRPQPNEPSAFKGKTAALVGATIGTLGCQRAFFSVRQVLTALGVLVIPTQLGISQAQNAFAEDGSLKNELHRTLLADVVSELAKVTSSLRVDSR
jgi:NAD(P)H-dependent FMN reductase